MLSGDETNTKVCMLILFMGSIALCTLANLDVWFAPVFWYFLAAMAMLLALQMELIGSRLSKPARGTLAVLLCLPLVVFIGKLLWSFFSSILLE